MKARMILNTDRSWQLKIYPETRVEQEIIGAANMGTMVNVKAYSDDDTGYIVIDGEGNNYTGVIEVPDEQEE